MTANNDEDKSKLRRKWLRLSLIAALAILLISCAILTKFFPDIVFGIAGVIIFAGAIFLVAKFSKKPISRDLESGQTNITDEFGFSYTAELTEIPPSYTTANAQPPCYDSGNRQNLNISDNLTPPPIVNFNEIRNSQSNTRSIEVSSVNVSNNHS